MPLTAFRWLSHHLYIVVSDWKLRSKLRSGWGFQKLGSAWFSAMAAKPSPSGIDSAETL